MRCRPGDLAMIIRCSYGTDVGKYVTVIRLCLEYPETWYCTSNSYIAGGAMECPVIHKPGQEFIIDDADLQPIRPPGITKTTKTEKPVTA